MWLSRRREVLMEELTQYSPTRGVVFILALSLLGWGFWVLNPWTTAFANPIYSVLMEVATEPAWGAAFVFAGGNLLHGAIKKSAESVSRGALIGWLLWLVVAIMYGLAEPTATVVVTNTCLALMHGWIYLQAHLHPQLLTGGISVRALENYSHTKEKNND